MKEEIDKATINEAIDLLVKGGADLRTMFAKEGLLNQLSKNIIERALAAEMDDHLGYERYGRSDSVNARNGSFGKQLITEAGVVDIEVPRDREGEFVPQLIRKNQKRIEGLDQKILSLYAKGMSLSDIKIQLHELYGAEISESLISKITDNVMDEVRGWQARPLEAVYP